MHGRRLLLFFAHTAVLMVLLIGAIVLVRVAAGGPLLLAEIGAAMLIALVYPRVLAWFGYSVPRLRE